MQQLLRRVQTLRSDVHCVSHRCVHARRPPSSRLWLCAGNRRGACKAETHTHLPSGLNGVRGRTDGGEVAPPQACEAVGVRSSSSLAAPPLWLDPPFTPVPGECAAAQTGSDVDAPMLLYVCGACA
ncbi:hypothetical protein DQ04_26171000, partial [Trypanosoma grayi]|uniref:hypothetical protein n=1 Tax=Trypanosoma grayi TaxID=71804 RepID=UPI0004F46A6D